MSVFTNLHTTRAGYSSGGARRFTRGAYARIRTSALGAPGVSRTCRTLVVAPHPDDETLGCGGTIADKRREGAEVDVVFMTDGSGSHAHLLPATELAAMRAREARAACQQLGVANERLHFLGLPDGALGDWARRAEESLSDIIEATHPQEVFVPYHGEAPADHTATTRIVLRALGRWGVATRVLSYPVWFWNHWPWVPLSGSSGRARALVRQWRATRLGLRFLADFRVVHPVSHVLDVKRRALEEHRSQMSAPAFGAEWLTLHDVAGGEFLECFFQDHEFFHPIGAQTIARSH